MNLESMWRVPADAAGLPHALAAKTADGLPISSIVWLRKHAAPLSAPASDSSRSGQIPILMVQQCCNLNEKPVR
jgi:hypothetical protein